MRNEVRKIKERMGKDGKGWRGGEGRKEREIERKIKHT